MLSSYRLGIDLGTAYTAAAVSRSGERGWTDPEVVTLGSRGAVIPSTLYVGSGGAILAGEAAERRTPADPHRALRGFTRRVGDPVPFVVDGRTWTPEELSALLVRHVVDRVAEREGGPTDRIAVTHPGSWTHHQKDLFLRALTGQGLSVTLVSEPQAAALHHVAAARLTAGSTVAVYDLGGGAFDAAVVGVGDASRLDLLGRAVQLRPQGGGVFDDAVFDHVRSALPGIVDGLDGDDPATPYVLDRLRRESVAAREQLSADTDVSIPVILTGYGDWVTLTRAEFESMIRPRVEETVEALLSVVTTAGLAPADLSVVLLIGGSATIPLVARLVAERLGRPVVVHPDPQVVIALGAAGATEAGHESLVVDDDVQFTVFRPAAVRPARWYPLLAFAHRSDPFVDPDSGQVVDPLELVKGEAERLLRDQSADFQPRTADSRQPLPRGGELLLRPWLDDGEVNPEQATLRWEEPVHRIEFRMRAAPGADGRRISGGLHVFLGVLLIAEVTFTVRVSSANPPGRPQLERIPVTRFRNIFASYSHQDVDVVDAVVRYVSATGDRYLIDSLNLRSGEEWEPALVALIDRSDIFQLFWSGNAMRSPHVRREWEHALSLRREGFIRPVFWEDPRPADSARKLPPDEIDKLHWARLPVRSSAPPVMPVRSAGSVGSVGPVGSAGPVGSVGRADGPRVPPASGRPAGAAAPRRGLRRRRGIAAAAASIAVGSAAFLGQAALVSTPSAAPPPATAAATTGSAPTDVVPDGPPVLPPQHVAASVPIPSIGPAVPVGGSPTFVTIAPSGLRAYVADPAAGVITVVDTAVNRVTATIPVGAGPPRHLAFSPDGRTAYVSIWDDAATVSAIGVLDVAGTTLTATIPVRTRPFAAAVSPDGDRLYVPLYDAAAVAVIDTDTRAVTTEIPVAAHPRAVELSTDGAGAYVVSDQAGLVSVIDIAGATVEAEVRVQQNPQSLAVSPRQPLLAVCNHGSSTVSMIDATADAVIATVPVGRGPQAVAWAADGRFAYVVGVADGTISVISAGTMAVTATIPTGPVPSSIAVSPDGSRAYVTNSGDGTLTVLDLTG